MAYTRLGPLGLPTRSRGGTRYELFLDESFSIASTVLGNLDNYDVAASESLSVSDSVLRVIGKNGAETITLQDTRVRSLSRTIQESATVVDTRVRHLSRQEMDALGITDAYARHYTVDVQENLTTDENRARDTAQPFSESLEYADSRTRRFGKNISEEAGLTDTYETQIGVHYTEAVGLTDAIAKRLYRGFDESVGYGEIPDYPRWIYEELGLTDPLARVIDAERNFTQTLEYADIVSLGQTKRYFDEASVADDFDKKLTKNFHETLGLRDTLLRSANAVMFDLRFREDVLTPEEMDTISDSPPVGYTPFRVFYPGDYQYTEGMYGIRVTGVDNGGQIGILGLKLNVDVPDVTERGAATVTGPEAAGSGEHTVTFTKTFTAIPEVYPVWTDGPTAAVPEIISVTTSGFVFILRDISSPATKVEGNITWAAIGR